MEVGQNTEKDPSKTNVAGDKRKQCLEGSKMLCLRFIFVPFIYFFCCEHYNKLQCEFVIVPYYFCMVKPTLKRGSIQRTRGIKV